MMTLCPSSIEPVLVPNAESETLSTPELCAALAQLAQAERRTEWLSCRHLAELADRFARRDPMLGGYADVFQLARLRFGMGVRRARERVRIGRALRGLPQTEQAFVEGSLGYARVRELTRVATPESEGVWLQVASELPLRALERRVAEASSGAEHAKTNEPATVRWASPDSIEVRLNLPAASWALFERAMAGARHKSAASSGPGAPEPPGRSLSDAEALEAVARDALARQTDGEDRTDLHNLLVLYQCRSCRRTEIETGAGPVELDQPAAQRLACDAKRCELESEGRTVSHGGPLPAPVRRAVLLRDRMRCRSPGCTRRRYVDVHHIEPREHGGAHSRSNCVTLCTSCHERIHDGRLSIEGDAEGELRFYDASGEELGKWATTPRGFSAAANRLLDVMGSRGGWHPDQLCSESGLAVSAVLSGLLELEIAGRVRTGPYGFEPAALT